MSKQRLLARLQAHAQQGPYPLHMPGHKRQTERFNAPLPYEIDLTEITGFDQLHAPQTHFREAQDAWAKQVGAARSYFMVNGSTGGILAACYGCLQPGDEVLVMRACHRSVYHALELTQARVHLIEPAFYPGWLVDQPLTPEALEAAFEAHPNVRLVIVTSPGYEGVVSPIRALAAVCHRKGALLLVDQAHGAHLRYHEALPEEAVAAGADLVVESLHKTLPCLTGTAGLHLSQRVCLEPIQRALQIFQTSSPSYVLLASIEEGLAFMQSEGQNRLADLLITLQGVRQEMAQIPGVRLFEPHDSSDPASGTGHPANRSMDLTKLMFQTPYPAVRVQAALTALGYELEMACGYQLLALCTVGDRLPALKRFPEALKRALDQLKQGADLTPAVQAPHIGGGQLTDLTPRLSQMRWVTSLDRPLAEAQRAPGHWRPLTKALGQLAGEAVWAYPPGQPLLLPGERISQQRIGLLQQLQHAETQIYSDSGAWPQIRVID